MQERRDVPLAQLTTLRLGGPARRLVEATSAEEAIEVLVEADARGEATLVVAGGSNLVVGRADDLVVSPATAVGALPVAVLGDELTPALLVDRAAPQ